MSRWLCQLRLAIGASLYLAASGMAWAQAPAGATAPPPVAVPSQGSVTPPAVIAEPAPEVVPPAAPRPVLAGIHDTLHRYGVGCYATIDTVGCSSLGSDLTFIFGSCRAFFGEPCAPGGGLTHGGCGPNGCR